jgi:proton-coupled amino acid transporter
MRRNLDEIEIRKVKLLGPVKTFFTLIKGFICTGILYLPNNIREGGWLFSAVGLFLSYIFTTVCMFKLLDAKKKVVGISSFKDIGMAAYGK